MMSTMMMSDGSSTQSNISISASAWSSTSLWTSKLIIKLIMLMLRDRPDFPSLAQTLERLPKKRLARFSIKVYLIFIQLNLHLVASLKPNFVPLSLFCRFHLSIALIYIWFTFDEHLMIPIYSHRSPSHPIHLSRSAEALFWDPRSSASESRHSRFPVNLEI